jgi:hypothetical protein
VVFDLSRNEVIHAHCVSATKMKGPHGPASPYIIRNHLETNEGAVLQVLMPSNEAVTVALWRGPPRHPRRGPNWALLPLKTRQTRQF